MMFVGNSLTGLAASIRALFANGEQGAWYDPSDTSTLYQDSAGTTPVTAVEQPVGLMLDKSKGRVVGSDLVTNGDFGSATGWTTGTGWSIGSGVATKTAGTASNLTQTISSTAAQWYLVSAVLTRTAGGITISLGTSGTTTGSVTAGGTYTWYILAGSGTQTLTFAADASFAGTVDNVSVKAIAGNHAYQSTSANRPTLSARYNVLTYTDDFTLGGVWSAGTGVSVANQKTITFASGGSFDFLRQFYSFVSGVTYTIVIRAKSVSGNTTMSVDLQNAQSVTDMILTTEFQVFQRQITPSAARTWIDIQLGGSGVIQLDYIDVRVSNDSYGTIPTYQRVTTSTDYDTVGFPPYLRFNGSSSAMLTNSVDFTGTDKVTVWSGVRKLSDAAVANIVELGIDSSVSAFILNSPFSATNSAARFLSRGTSAGQALSGALPSPISFVAAGIGNISGDQAILRINGAQVASSTADQGTGNYGNYPLYIGARGNSASIWFNGRLYGLVVRGAQSNAAQIERGETYMNVKTGKLW